MCQINTSSFTDLALSLVREREKDVAAIASQAGSRVLLDKKNDQPGRHGARN